MSARDARYSHGYLITLRQDPFSASTAWGINESLQTYTTHIDKNVQQSHDTADDINYIRLMAH